MIFVLKDADFSGENLGRISVDPLSQFTLAAITASGNNSMTEVQKFSLNAFFKTIGAFGNVANPIINRMRKIYLPMIAGNVSKGLVNYATNEFAIDVELDSANWEIRNHGLIGKDSAAQTINLTIDNPIQQDDFSTLYLRTEPVPVGSLTTQFIAILRGKQNTNKFLGLKEDANDGVHLNLAAYGYRNVLSYVSLPAPAKITGASIRGTNDNDFIMCGNWSHNKTISFDTATGDMSGESTQTLYVLGFNNKNKVRPYGCIMLGDALTRTEMENTVNAIDALWEAFNV